MCSIPGRLDVQEDAAAGTSMTQKGATDVMVLASKVKGHAQSACSKARKVGSVSHDIAPFLDDAARLAVEAERQGHKAKKGDKQKMASNAWDGQAAEDDEDTTTVKKKKKKTRRKSEDPE
jgi:hypothetical protein